MRDVLRQVRAPFIALVVGLAIFYGGNQYIYIDRGHVVMAEFKDVSGLTPASDVKIGGVRAGTVTAIKLTEQDTALVVMTLEPEALPVGRNAAAQMRPVNLLGEKFVDISPGDLETAMPEGGKIPIARTSTSVELDEILNVLDVDTRARIGILMAESGIALQGRGTDFNRLLAELPPSLEQARALVDGIGQDKRELAALIEQSDRVLASINRESPDLQQLVVEAEGALETVAQRRAQLGETLREAPSALVQARETLADLERTAEELRPASRAIRTHAPSVTATLRVLPPFTEDAVPALAAVERTSPALEELSRGALPPLRRLRPTAAKLRDFVDRADPVISHLDEGGVTAGLLDFMYGWARTIRKSDGLGHFFGLRLLIDDTALRSLLSRYCEALRDEDALDDFVEGLPDNAVTDLLEDLGIRPPGGLPGPPGSTPSPPTPEEIEEIDCEELIDPLADAVDERPDRFFPSSSRASEPGSGEGEAEPPAEEAQQVGPPAPPVEPQSPPIEQQPPAGAPQPQDPEARRAEDALLDYLLDDGEAVKP